MDVSVTFLSPIPVDSGWIKFNYDHTGYYYVNYEPPMWARFALQLATDHLINKSNGQINAWCLVCESEQLESWIQYDEATC